MSVKKTAVVLQDEDTLDMSPVPSDTIASGGSINTSNQYRLVKTFSYVSPSSGRLTYFAGQFISDPIVISKIYSLGAQLQQVT